MDAVCLCMSGYKNCCYWISHTRLPSSLPIGSLFRIGYFIHDQIGDGVYALPWDPFMFRGAHEKIVLNIALEALYLDCFTSHNKIFSPSYSAILHA